MEEDLNGLEAVWNWFVMVVSSIADVFVDVWDWVDTWPMPFKLVGAGALAALILVGVLKK